MLYFEKVLLNTNSFGQGVGVDAMRRSRTEYHYCITSLVHTKSKKIGMYAKCSFDTESFYGGTTIRELCEASETVARNSLNEVNCYQI